MLKHFGKSSFILIMTCGLQDKNFAFNLLVTYAYRMHIQDGGMHAAFDQNKAIYFENQARYGIIFTGSFYIILNVL